MRLFSFFLLGFIICFNTLNAQQTYDLKYCIETGLNHNFDIRIVKNEQKITDNNATAGNAGYLPSLDLSSSYSGSLSNLQQQYPADGSAMVQSNNKLDQTFDAGIYLNWTVFDGLNIQANYSKLKEFQQMGKLNTQLMMERFITELCTEYYNYVQQNIRLKNLQYALALSRERLRIVEAQYSIGSMSNLDFKWAEVDFNTDSSKLIKQQEVLFSSLVRLNQLMALDNLEQSLHTPDTNIELKMSFDKDIVWQKVLNNNIFLLLSEKEIDINTLKLKSVQSKNYPYLRVNAGYGYTHNRYQKSIYSKQNNVGLTYGVTLGINLFDGMNRSRNQVNAKIEVENSKLTYEKLQLELKSDFTNIWMAYQNNMNLIQLEKGNLSTAKDTYGIAIERYKLGTLSGIELREAQNSLLEADERYLQAVYNTKLCEISLLQISGEVGNYLN